MSHLNLNALLQSPCELMFVPTCANENKFLESGQPSYLSKITQFVKELLMFTDYKSYSFWKHKFSVRQFVTDQAIFTIFAKLISHTKEKLLSPVKFARNNKHIQAIFHFREKHFSLELVNTHLKVLNKIVKDLRGASYEKLKNASLIVRFFKNIVFHKKFEKSLSSISSRNSESNYKLGHKMLKLADASFSAIMTAREAIDTKFAFHAWQIIRAGSSHAAFSFTQNLKLFPMEMLGYCIPDCVNLSLKVSYLYLAVKGLTRSAPLQEIKKHKYQVELIKSSVDLGLIAGKIGFQFAASSFSPPIMALSIFAGCVGTYSSLAMSIYLRYYKNEINSQKLGHHELRTCLHN